jgi:hypothetical protein
MLSFKSLYTRTTGQELTLSALKNLEIKAAQAAVLILTALDSRCGRDLLWEGNHEAGEGQEGGPWRAEVLLSGGWQKVLTPF